MSEAQPDIPGEPEEKIGAVIPQEPVTVPLVYPIFFGETTIT